MPHMFEDDNKFENDVSKSIAAVVQGLSKRKADISTLVKRSNVTKHIA